MQWENERRLYERMSDYEGMMGAYAVTDAFYTSANNGKVGAYYQAEYAAKSIYNYPSSIANGLQTSATQLEANRLAIEAILAGLAQAQTFEDSALIYQDANERHQSALLYAAALYGYQAQAQVFSNTAALDAYMSTIVLPADNLLEQNRKTIQRLYLQTLGIGIAQLSPQQLELAEVIAVQCPLEGGSAVYTARALYRLNVDRVFIDDSICGPSQERRATKSQSDLKAEIKLVPNPATETVNISGLASDPAQASTVTITNTNGVVFAKFQVIGNELSFSVSSLPSGIYFCKVQSVRGCPKTLKLAVSH